MGLHQLLARTNYSASALPIATLFAGLSRAVHCLARLWRTLLSLRLLKWPTNSVCFTISVSFNMTRKADSSSQPWQHASVFVLRLGPPGIIWQSLVHSSDKNQCPRANVKEEVIQVSTAFSDSASEATGMAVRVSKFNFAHYRYEDLFLRVNLTVDAEIPLYNINNAQDVFLVQFFCDKSNENARKTLSVTTTVTASYYEACKGASLINRSVIDGTASVAILNARRSLLALPDRQKAANVARAEAPMSVRCATRLAARPIVQTKVFMLSNHAKQVTIVVRHAC